MKKTILLSFLSALTMMAVAQHDEFTQYDVRYITNNQILLNPDLQSAMRNSAAWQSFKSDHPDWWVSFNEQTGMPHRAAGTPVNTSAATPEQAAMNFISNELSMFEIPVADLEMKQINQTKKNYIVNFIQQHNGIEVLWSNLTLRINPDMTVSMFGADVYRNMDVNLTPAISASSVSAIALLGIPQQIISSTAPELKILPITGNEKINFHLVYEVTVKSEETDGTPGEFYTLVDAHSGDVLYRENQVHATDMTVEPEPVSIDLTVEGSITDNVLDPMVVRGLPYLDVTVSGNTDNTDENGFLSLSNGGTVNATFDLTGPYADVYLGQTGNVQASFSQSVGQGSTTVTFDNDANTSEISAYYGVNVIHDYMRALMPVGFNDMDFSMETRVDRTDGDCNAFYDGGVNFYAAGSGCPATALFNDIIFHEYGHGINDYSYNFFGGNFSNGALGEGYADVWGLGKTENPILGLGFQGGNNTFVRRYDVAPKVYPQDLVGEVHADGEIIAGAWWDYAENINNDVQGMMALFVETLAATLTASNGNEGSLYADILLEALLQDDDNGNINDGTPNDISILEAFAEHGITLIANAQLTHTEIATPLLSTDPIDIDATLVIDANAFIYFGGLDLHWRLDDVSAWTVDSMTNTGGSSYTFQIPSQPEGTIVRYYFTVHDIFSNQALIKPYDVNLANDPNIPFYMLIGFTLKQEEDFDNNFGVWYVDPFNWDDATTGVWTMDDPTGSYSTVGDPSTICQTDDDHSSVGNTCAFTGNAGSSDALGTNDVDAGQTTLLSAEFNCSGFADPVMTYYRWYINDPATGANPGNDPWQAWVTSDGNNFVMLERTYTSDRSWRRYAFNVNDYVTPSSTVMLMFACEDSLILGQGLQFDGGSIVEGAVDDVFLYDVGDDTSTVPDAIAEIDQMVFNVFPNPALNADINLSVDNYDGTAIQVMMYNESGQQVFVSGKKSWSRYFITIPAKNLPAGIYFIKAVSEKNMFLKKVVIQ